MNNVCMYTYKKSLFCTVIYIWLYIVYALQVYVSHERQMANIRSVTCIHTWSVYNGFLKRFNKRDVIDNTSLFWIDRRNKTLDFAIGHFLRSVVR